MPTENLEYLATDHLIQDLAKHAASGGVITAAAQGAKFVLNLTSTVALARLLSPKDFGLVGMVLAVTALLGLFKDLGLSTATVQRETITHDQVSTLFWINAALGALVCFIGIGLAPVVAWFYGDSQLAGIMFFLSFTFPLAGATVQHQALLFRQMRFRAIAIVEVLSMLVSILVGCFLALFGFEHWSLVGMQLSLAAAGLVLTWWASGWHPSMPNRHSDVGPLIRFGVHLSASDIVGRLTSNGDRILIGRFFGAEPLGLYSRASVLLNRPLEQLLAPVSAVLIPVLARLQSDPARYRRTFIRANDTLALITFPFAALCLVLAEPMVLVILGPQWKGVVPLFSGFTLVALSLPLSYGASWLFMSQGRGKDLLHTYLITGAVTAGAYILGLPWGPLGVVLSLAVASFTIRLPIIYHLAGQHGPVRSSDLWKILLSHLPGWVTVYVTTTLARALIAHAAPIVQLLVCVPLGLATGAALTLALPRPRDSAWYAWNTMRGSLPRLWRGEI